mmetsp:Transcript_53915/g.157300  ORF Transcript_53915/g.157300 Transcript_53915/m.157300 type:complete len:206 (+) Transcript_53915:687-1304(+)
MRCPFGVPQRLRDVLRELVLALTIHLRNLEAGSGMSLRTSSQQLGGTVPVALLQQRLAQVEARVGLVLLEGQAQESLALPTILLHSSLDTLRQQAAQAALRAAVAQLGRAAEQLQAAGGVGLDSRACGWLPSPISLGIQRLRLVLSTRLVEPFSCPGVILLADQRQSPAVLRCSITRLRRLEVPRRRVVCRSLSRVFEVEEELRS